jgi:filamentous hemagglutinin
VLGSVASVRVTERGMAILERHVNSFSAVPQNEAMVSRLRDLMGRTASGASAQFYLHEISEATMMRSGMSYESAHAASLAKYGASPYALYAPEVVKAFPGMFNSNWQAFWNIE